MSPGNQPDSVLEAARKTAAALGLNWSDLQPIYRDLQTNGEDGEASWLPKSQGRRIFTAHPHYVARLLIALGFRSPKMSPSVTNFIAWGLTPEGRDLYSSEWPTAGHEALVIQEFGRLLSDPDAADTLAAVRFDPAEKSITFSYSDGSEDRRFVPSSGGYWRGDQDLFRQRVRKLMDTETRDRMSTSVVIDGAALAEISRTVAWRLTGSPVRAGQSDEADD